ncbi:MAG: DNA topoisomerase [Gemmatimonadetes bacterium]|nr:MAG: DNA topoisomerase [Gemmatimonadota bacterium]
MSEWIHREGSKSKFRYRRGDGRLVRDARTLERIRMLAIPPGWRDVHIAPGPHASVQAWGLDTKGRKQYRYHARAVERGQLRKYDRVRELAKTLPDLRRRIRRAAAAREPTKRAVAAAVVQLVSESFFRIGSERYAEENRTFGIATLLKKHVEISRGHAIFSYVGKRGIRQRQVVANRALARLVARHLRSPGSRLFRYKDGSRWRNLTARDVNAYLHDTLGVPFSAKDFRTWGGTLRAATVLAELGAARSETEAKRNVVTAMRLVAAELGNTPAICRASYVHPIVVARYLDEGETIRLPERYHATASSYAHSPEERALIRFLDRHFPERRKRMRK